MRKGVIGIALLAVISTQAIAGDAPVLRQPFGEFTSTDRSQLNAIQVEMETSPETGLPALALWKALRPDPDHRGGDFTQESLAKGRDEAVPALVALLDHEDAKLREAAIQILGWVGAPAEPAVPALVRALRDPAWGVRMQASFTLRGVGVFPADVIAGLRHLLGDEAWIVANAASMALASAPAATTPALAGALADASPRVRRFAAHAFAAMSRPPEALLPALFDILEDDEPEVQLEVIAALAKLPASELRGAVPTLVSLLDSPRVRCEAARLLAAKGGTHSPKALPALITLMKSPRGADECADRAFRDIAAVGPAAVPALVGLLDHPAAWTRRNAVIALKAVEPRTADALKAIAGVLADESIGGNAQQVLAEIGADAVAVLTEVLASDSSAARRRSAYALSRIGPGASDAVPTLLARLPAETGDTKRAMIAAIGSIGSERAQEAIPELRRALNDPSLRRDAAGALARIAGPQAVDVAPILIEALRIEVGDACPQGVAAFELTAIGSAALPQLLALLTDGSFPSKPTVLGLIDKIGSEAWTAARPVFAGWIEDDASPWALYAAERLQQLDDPVTERMIAIFMKALAESNPWQRLRGAEGLARAGAEPARARSVLLDLQTHDYELIRSRAGDALQKIAEVSPPAGP